MKPWIQVPALHWRLMGCPCHAPTRGAVPRCGGGRVGNPPPCPSAAHSHGECFATQQNTHLENEISLQAAEISETQFWFEPVYSLKPAASESELQDAYRECCSSWPGQSASALPSEGHAVTLSHCHPVPSRLLFTEYQQCTCKQIWGVKKCHLNTSWNHQAPSNIQM